MDIKQKNVLLIIVTIGLLVFIIYSNAAKQGRQCWVEGDEYFTEGGLMTDWAPNVDSQCGTGTVVQSRTCTLKDPRERKTKCGKFPYSRRVELKPCAIMGQYIRFTRVAPRSDIPDDYKAKLAFMRIMGNREDHNIISVTASCIDPAFPAKNLVGEQNGDDYTTTCSLPKDQQGIKQWIEADIGSNKEIRSIQLHSGDIPPNDTVEGSQITIFDSKRKPVFTGPVFAGLRFGKSRATITLTPTVEVLGMSSRPIR